MNFANSIPPRLKDNNVMESILEICNALGDINLDECQQILDNPLDSSDHNVDLPDKTLMEQAIPKFRTLKKEITRNVATINSLKKLCALAILCITRSDDQEAKILAARLIIVMCSLPSSSAFGIINSNVMLAVLTSINKIIGVELKKVSKTDTTKSNNEGLNMNLQLDARPSQHINSSQATEECSSEIEECSADEKEDLFATNSRNNRSQIMKLNNLTEKLRPQQLFALLQDIKACITLFASQSDEFILNSCADLFVAIMYLCSSKPEYSSSAFLCQASMVGFASQNRASLISSYRALMPILSLQSRNPLLPDIAKIKRNCHKAAIAIVVEIIKVTCQAEHLLNVEVPAEVHSEATAEDIPGSPESVDTSPIHSERRSSTGSTSSTSNITSITTSELPLAHTCIIGVLQRLTLSPPDRAPIRQVVLSSIVEVITALGYGLLQQQQQEDEDFVEQMKPAVVRSIEHYLLFLSRLSKSTRVAHRAFSLDITAQLLSTLWLWELPSSSTINVVTVQDSATTTPTTVNDSLCVILLQVLQDRCQDCSPAVRSRALGAIYDLLSTLSEDSSKSMMYAIYDAVMAAKPIQNDDNLNQTNISRISLIDTLRERTTDEKPQVRTKALQTLSTALSMKWLKPNPDSSNMEISYINMLITEEDIDVFSHHCRDTSLSVRKQALFSLTELLISRPADSLLQDIWIQSVLPMTFDAESSVTNKVAETLHTLLFDNLIQWYHTHQQINNTISAPPRHHNKGVDLERAECISLVWTLCTKITAMGMLKILKSALGIMLKQGFLTAAAFTKTDFKSSSILAIITVLKYACCLHIDTSTTSTATTIDNSIVMMELSEENRHNLQNKHEMEEVIRGAWILLEGLVSLEAMTMLNTKQESIKFRDFIQQAGSADFVIRCYRQKHTTTIAVAQDNHLIARWDEEDLRIFKVLESLGGNLNEKDSIYIKQEIIENLQYMQCECHIAAAAIAVLHQLSKTEVADVLTTSYASARPSNQVLVDSIKLWTAPLLKSVHTVLHMYALRTPLVGDEKVIECSNNNGVQHLLLDWLQETTNAEHMDTSLTLDISALPSNTTTHSLTSEVLEAVQTALFILGELSMLGFSMEEDHFLGNQNAKKVDEAHASTKSASQFRLAIDPAVIALVKILMGHSLPVTNATTASSSTTTLAAATAVLRDCPNKIRANAFVTMGKLCLRNKTLAREHVNIYLREISQQHTAAVSGASMNTTLNISAITTKEQLNQSNLSQQSITAAAAAVRSNALLVLGDLCIRYTNLVDRHVDTMAQCLQDSDSNVRKNALILLTQLLLQDFLKWKGFLLYRFLLLTVDSDVEIAEFSRNILHKTLRIKYPQLLTDHFTEALVILNNCTAHPAYTSIVRTGSTAIEDGTIQTTTAAHSTEDTVLHTDGINNIVPEAVVFTCSLSKVDRFSIYSFMAENLDDEMKIQVSAKIVQDILSAAVDNAVLLPPAAQRGGSRDRDRFQAFECVLDDALTLLRSPHLKVGQKKASDGNDEAADDDLHEPATAANATANNTKTAFIRAKTKILQKLSTQHLISHTLPVVISLKHCLETTKSSLQGALMEFLISLIKHHKNEVEEALQFDPTLRAEIEYDLKQFERAKKDKLNAAVNAQIMSTRKSPHPNPLRAPSTAKKALSPYLDLQQLPAHSIVKPSLKKSLSGQASRGRTPYDALKSPGLGLARSAVRSALAGSGGRFQDEGDDLDRLTFSQQDATADTGAVVGITNSTSITSDSTSKANLSAASAELWGVDCATQKLFADEDEHAPVGSTLMSTHKQSRRRSWGVVVDSLLPGISPVASAGTGSTRNSLSSTATGSLHSPLKDRSSPPKKKRCRKSNSPNKPLTASSHKAVSFSVKLTASSEGTTQQASENIPPTVCNTVNSSVTTVENESGNNVVKRGGGRSRATAALNSSNTLLSASLAVRTVDGDEAVNAFDRLLATASQPSQGHTTAAATSTTAAAAGRRMGKRGSTQQGDSLMGLF